MIRFPTEIYGWLSKEEGVALARLSAGKRVLEIGCYNGRSTICLAQTAAEVHAVDPFDGRGTPKPRNTLDEFKANLVRYGVADRVVIHVSTSAKADLPGGFGLAFIDGAHDYQSVMADVAMAMKSLAPDGLLCFHDCSDSDREVQEVVEDLVKAGAEIVERHGTLAVARPGKKPQSRYAVDEPVVALSMPRRGLTVSYGAMLGLQNAVSRPMRVISLELSSCSVLDHNFNQHWAEALNCRDTMGVTHFAMIHDDIAPAAGWLTTLLDELTSLKADVVSAVVPLKDERGLTSTAVYDGIDPWHLRRLSLTEVNELPDTFCADDIEPLLLNTGLWVCDLRKPWCDDWHFSTLTRIVKRSGRRVAECLSEDWHFSHWLNQRVAKLYATSKVPLFHEGTTQYGNGEPWGAWTTDETARELEAA